MVLRDWLKGLEYECIRGSLDTEVSEVVYDSRKAAPGAVYAWQEPGWIPTGSCRMY